jgi:hypothetical protein
MDFLQLLDLNCKLVEVSSWRDIVYEENPECRYRRVEISPQPYCRCYGMRSEYMPQR